MKPERILSLLGYDPALLRELSAEHRSALRGGGVVWLLACLILGASIGYSAWLIESATWTSVFIGLAGTILLVNLLRVIIAGGGGKQEHSLLTSEAAARRYRPSLIPALIFGVLAALLSQPAQLAFWPDLDEEVERHRQELISQHNIAASDLGTDADYYQEELEAAGFPIFRLKLIWQQPRRALRLTFLMCLLVLLPSFWSQVVSIGGVRAYEWQRCRRTHRTFAQLKREGNEQVAELLTRWPSYRSQS